MTIEQIKNTGKPIALIGMMGAGKTHVGEALAALMQVRFIDTDAVIEQQTSQSIAQIFAQQGEQAFRVIESEVITQAIQNNPGAVIATGGGCVTTESVRITLQQALTCWLVATPEEIYGRIKTDTSRPLLQTENPLQTLKDLLAQREQYYAQAAIQISTASEDPPAIAREIINLLSDHLNTVTS